jgi:hypothetical protein
MIQAPASLFQMRQVPGLYLDEGALSIGTSSARQADADRWRNDRERVCFFLRSLFPSHTNQVYCFGFCRQTGYI